MPIFLGIDASGRRTHATLANEQEVLARAEIRSIRPLRVGVEQAAKDLAQMIEEILHTAVVERENIASVCTGIAGVQIPGVKEWVSATIKPFAPKALIEVCGDEEIALDGAFHGGPGVLVIAGLGSNCIARDENGDTSNVGGWGHMLGDEGSEYWIGLTALRAACRAESQRQPSQLFHEIASYASLKSLPEVVGWAHGNPTPDFTELAPIVSRCAEEGDALANQILSDAGDKLAEMALLARWNLHHYYGSKIDPFFAVTGSVLEKIKLVRKRFETRILQTIVDARILAGTVDPVEGALWRARNRSHTGGGKKDKLA